MDNIHAAHFLFMFEHRLLAVPLKRQEFESAPPFFSVPTVCSLRNRYGMELDGMNVTAMARSLGYYVYLKQQANVAQADFEHVDDYHDFLGDVVAEAQAGAKYAGFNATNPLIPLEEITLTQIQYGDIVNQIFSGVNFMVLSLPHPAPQVPVVQNSVSYFDNYIQSLDGGKGDPRTKADVESIIERMNKLLSEREANEQRVNGLVVGRVQSGKTRNYVGLMLKAVDEGWNVIIVLTSSNTALADQTEGRIKDDFAKAQVYTQIVQNFRDKNAATEPIQLLAPNNTSFHWGVAMKESHNLDNILDWLHKNESIAPKMRILVIDDEADNATPDSNTGRKNQLTESEVDDLIAVVHDENDGDSDFSNLAKWMEDIQDEIVKKQEIADSDPGSKEDVYIKSLKTKLGQAGNAPDKVTEILAEDDYLTLLNLHQYMDDGGVLVDVKQEIIKYFNATGRSARSAGTFLKFLNTILEVAIERSAISRRICELIDCKPGTDEYSFDFSRCAYIAYTATPYANILNERPDQTPLYADFIKSLTTSPRYFGLDKIFGRNYKKRPSVPNMNIVDAIGDDDKRYVLNPIQGIKDKEMKEVLDVELSDDLRYACAGKEGSWVSMKRAIAWAFCTAGARRRHRLNDVDVLDKLDDRWTTMMVNISQKQGAHTDLQDAVKKYLKLRCGAIDARENFIEECRVTWEYFTHGGKAAYTKTDFDKAFNSDKDEKYGEIVDYPDWNEIKEDVRYFIDGWEDIRVHAIIINSANANNIENQNRYNQTGKYKDTLANDHLWIVIGGNTIGRGLTLRGLTVSYFDRVRKTVAVDTMTQMGRWFGYRGGYELLPRIWMTADTVLEMQKTAFVEGAMHESMQENFNEGYSPSDPEHYQKIYSWGRKLSGRARAQGTFMKSVGMLATTDYISVVPENIAAIYDKALGFIGSLGPQMDRSGDVYQYPELPVWADIDKNVVKEYLDSIVDFSPEGTRQKLRAILREIRQTEEKTPGDTKWHVVIGEPKTHTGKSYQIGVDRNIFSGSPETVKVEGGVASYGSVRSDRAFYAMITTRCINYTDAEFAESDKTIKKIKATTKANGGKLPAVVKNALAPYPGITIEARLEALAQEIKNDPSKSVPTAIHECLPEGFRNRSAIEYREAIYTNAGHVQPIMQLYMLEPPTGSTEKPLIAHAFYWPNHSPDDFNLVTIGMAPVAHNPSVELFNETVAEILSQNGFPMHKDNLRTAVFAALPECTEDFFEEHIKHPANGAKHAKLPNKKAYYHTDWASDPVAKIRQFILEQAAEILADHQPHKREDLAKTVFANNPKLKGLFNYESNADVNAVFAAENLPQFGIVKTSGSPVTFQIP